MYMYVLRLSMRVKWWTMLSGIHLTSPHSGICHFDHLPGRVSLLTQKKDPPKALTDIDGKPVNTRNIFAWSKAETHDNTDLRQLVQNRRAVTQPSCHSQQTSAIYSLARFYCKP